MRLTPEQVTHLLAPINPLRVLTRDRMSYVAQQDIRAHMTRIFGFCNWSTDVLETAFVFEEQDDNKRWRACYRATVQVTVHNQEGEVLAHYTDSHVSGNAPQPDRAEAHALALTTAVSTAFKRACTNLGDQFGLSLYNKGQTTAFVKGTLVGSDQPVEVAAVVDLGEESQDEPTPPPATATPSPAAEVILVDLRGAVLLPPSDRIQQIAEIKTRPVWGKVKDERTQMRDGTWVTLERLADRLTTDAMSDQT